LGLRFLKGDGVAKDLNAAKKWITAAAVRKHPEALNLLRQLRLEKKEK